MGTVCRFTQINGTKYKLELIANEEDGKRGYDKGWREREVNVEGFLRESSVLRSLHNVHPECFTLNATNV